MAGSGRTAPRSIPAAMTIGGAPREPGTSPRLLDRFWQNLRRAVGWNVQYAGAVEPQKRLAPHAHFAIRGTIPRALIRRVAAATYHQVWWPPLTVHYQPSSPPEWSRTADGYTDPDNGQLLPSWDD